MISREKNFLFVHIPKTGGSAIQIALEAYSTDDYEWRQPNASVPDPSLGITNPDFPTLHIHSKLPAYRKALGPDLCDRLFKFSCVRNPWDRAMSYYFWGHRGAEDWDRDKFLDFMKPRGTMESWIRRPGTKPRKRSKRPLNYLLRRPRLGVDYLMRFERLESDFHGLCRKLDLPKIDLPRYNVGPHRDYCDFYDSELIELIGEQFRVDVEMFGYEPPRLR